MTHDPITLMSRVRAGDEQAASELYNCYVERLIALARTRLSRKMGRRVGPDDIVQSVFRSFFTKAREGQFVFEESEDLWRLLSNITVTKVLRSVQRNRRGKRSIDLEESIMAPGSDIRIPAEFVLKGPSPTDAVVLLEEMEHIMSGLKPLYREVLELRLRGDTTEQIAVQSSRSERTVRRVLEHIRELLDERLMHQRNDPLSS